MMKNLLHNISILAMLALIMIGTLSCSDDVQEATDVQVSFTATLPTERRSRSFGQAEQVNTLVVGVFDENSKEIQRKTFPISGTSCDVTLALAQNQTYNFIFWAYYYDDNQNIYNIYDLTAIKMNELPNPVTFQQSEATDAFFAIEKGMTVTGTSNHTVELVRPLAQINVGTTGKAMQATFKAKSAPNTFHPFTNSVSGTADFTWNFSGTSTETFSADSKEYNYLAIGYVFAPTTVMQIEAELTLADKTLTFPQVEIKANQRSNIAGNFTATE